MLKINDVNNKSGSLKNLNLTIVDSRTATNTLNARIFARNKIKASGTSPRRPDDDIPQGKNIFAPNARKIKNLFAAAHSISASLFPEYSRTIASWIMVSSRWVAGLSKGKRPVSASMAIINAASARVIGAKAKNENEATAPEIVKRFVE